MKPALRFMTVTAIAVISMFSYFTQAATAKNTVAICSGKAIDSTAIEMKFCFQEPTRPGTSAIRKACVGSTVETMIGSEREEYGVPSKILISNSDYVGVTVLNDGLENHAEIIFSSFEFDRGWNTMKVSSVKTGKKYLSVAFACKIQ